jgi:hypothetical protein
MPFFNFDIPCPSCGYNLRGLSLDRGCPECGVKVVSLTQIPDEQAKTKLLEAEIEENLKQQEEQEAHKGRINAFLTDWERRGERFDRMLDRIEGVLGRLDKDH